MFLGVTCGVATVFIGGGSGRATCNKRCSRRFNVAQDWIPGSQPFARNPSHALQFADFSSLISRFLWRQPAIRLSVFSLMNILSYLSPCQIAIKPSSLSKMKTIFTQEIFTEQVFDRTQLVVFLLLCLCGYHLMTYMLAFKFSLLWGHHNQHL